MKSFKKVFSVFKLLSVVMAVTIVLTGCTGKQGEQGEKGERGEQGVAGKDGKTPTITINAEGYWVINGEVTSFKATGTDGKNGVNGKDGKDGKDGQTPAITINEEGYWVINGTVTNVKATGQDGTNGVNGTDGKDGETPVITINKDGYWVINGKVTEFKATGTDGKNGEDGQTPTITINEEGYWVINGTATEYRAVPVVMSEGDGQTFHMFAPSTLSFRSNAPLREFQEVKVNGETVDPSNYTLTEGSTIVTFNTDYLKTLDTKKHDVTIVSTSGSANANFEVIKPELNEYGFYYNQPYTGYDVAVETGEDKDYIFFFYEDGTMDVICLNKGLTFQYSYTFENDILTINSRDLGKFTATVNETEIYSDELGTTFKIGEEVIVADEDYIYTYKEELGGYEVNAIDKTKSKYIDIKSNINNIPVVKLSTNMFESNTNLIVAPKIPDSVKIIGEWAFYWCENLKSITIPDSVTIIEDSAFTGCTALTSITIPDSVTSIGGWTFEDSGLTSITIPNGVTSIGNRAFFRCTGLTSITIPDSVTSIGDSAFVDTGLTSVTIPDSVTSIGEGAFNGCTNLTSVKVDENNSVFDSRNNSNAIIKTATNELIAGCKNTVIPESVTSIGDYAFSDCTGLTSITIPDSVTSIGYFAFYNNESLKTINYEGTKAEWNAISKDKYWDYITPSDKVINYNYVG